MEDFLRRALMHGFEMKGIIHPNKVNEYVDMHSSDRRYKLKWLARDFYCGGCSSGIISYHGLEYYFSVSRDGLYLEYHR